MPNPLPAANVSHQASQQWRYYMNVCTVSYSSVWWDFERWEFELDWMALNGINMPLGFTGQVSEQPATCCMYEQRRLCSTEAALVLSRSSV